MTSNLRAVLRGNCIQHSAARVEVAKLVALVHQHLDKADWPRGRILAELVAAGFVVGMGSDGRYWIGGLAPRGEWVARDGQLEFATTRA